MDNTCIALLMAAFYALSIVSLRFIGRTVPIVLIGLPVILAGLGAIGVAALLKLLAVTPVIMAVGALVAALASAWHGWRIATCTFSDTLKK
jgi:hypothetical protein